VPINCAAIPDTLLESELFGHEKGAFTGAIERRQGCFELADHGTLFLDEIAEMTPATQVKLLRVLQERSFRRVGGKSEQGVDIRIVAATNQDPPTAVKDGKLREDLYYRLNVFEIKLPPLRDRKDDIPLLIQGFINEFNARNSRTVAAVDPGAMAVLEAYSWPGNVRELRNVMERATIVADGRFIEVKDLPTLVDSGHPGAPAAGASRTRRSEADPELVALALQHDRLSYRVDHPEMDVELRSRAERGEITEQLRPPRPHRIGQDALRLLRRAERVKQAVAKTDLQLHLEPSIQYLFSLELE
jgi:transcriptional regulator with PAS, ATPase and Fis domain